MQKTTLKSVQKRSVTTQLRVLFKTRVLGLSPNLIPNACLTGLLAHCSQHHSNFIQDTDIVLHLGYNLTSRVVLAEVAPLDLGPLFHPVQPPSEDCKILGVDVWEAIVLTCWWRLEEGQDQVQLVEDGLVDEVVGFGHEGGKSTNLWQKTRMVNDVMKIWPRTDPPYPLSH